MVALLAALGCSNSKQPVAKAPKAHDPQASFEQIVQNFRHYLDQLQVEPITEVENGAFSDFRLSREVVDYECVPPANAGDDYRGNITVAVRWSHSFRPPLEQPQEKSDEQDDAEQIAQEQSAEDAVRDGIQILDSEAVANLKTGSRIPTAIAPHVMGKSESEEEKLTFQLVRRNERWELADEPKADDGESDSAPSEEPQPSRAKPAPNYKSVDNALARALRLQ
jgi:hypothetical protein